MRSFVSDVARDIKPSGIRKFFDLVLTMDSDDVISLGVGEPDFDTPWSISKAAITSIEKGMTMYTSNRGLPELCGLLCEDFKNRYGVEYDPKSEVIFTTGVSEGLDIGETHLWGLGDCIGWFKDIVAGWLEGTHDILQAIILEGIIEGVAAVVGFLPGLGGPAASVIAYSNEKNMAKDRDYMWHDPIKASKDLELKENDLKQMIAELNKQIKELGL